MRNGKKNKTAKRKEQKDKETENILLLLDCIGDKIITS